MNTTQQNSLPAIDADMQFIAVLQACGFVVQVRADPAYLGRPAVYGTIDNALSLFNLAVAGADCVPPDGAA